MSKNLYRDTFSHVRSAYEFNMEDFQKAKKVTKLPEKALIIAAVVAVLAAFGITASATGFFGLSSPAVGDKTKGDDLSMQGFAESPESAAMREYMGGGMTLEEAAGKYGLEVRTDPVVLDYDELTDLLGGEIHDDRNLRAQAYIYGDGTFAMDGSFAFSDGRSFSYSLYRAVKGSITASAPYIGEGEYDEWSVKVGRTDVSLALGGRRSLMAADLGGCYVFVNVLTGTLGDGDLGAPIGRGDLETLAKSFNWSVLSHIAAPEPQEEPQVLHGAGVELKEEYIDRDQCFLVNLTGWGKINFITYLPTPEFADARFFLSRDGKVSDFEFPPILTGESCKGIPAVSFEDVTGDGAADVLVLIDYVSASGGAHRDLRVFSARGQGDFGMEWELVSGALSAIDNSKLNVAAVRNYFAGNREPAVLENTDGVLWTVKYTLDGRDVILEAVGRKQEDGQGWGVKELRFWLADSEGNKTTQMLQPVVSVASEAGEDFVPGPLGKQYTRCGTLEGAVTVGDMNFDGLADIGVSGGAGEEGAFRYYWLWNSGEGRYVYALTLTDAAVDEAAKTVTERVRGADGRITVNVYKPDWRGDLKFVRSEDGQEGVPAGGDGAYARVLQDFLDRGESEGSYREYTVADLDGDGVEELLVKQGFNEADLAARVYTMRDGQAVEAGEFDMGHSMLYVDESGAVLRVMGLMGDESIDRITLVDGNISREEISHRFLGEEDSYAAPGTALIWTDWGDRSLVETMSYSDVLDAVQAGYTDPGTTIRWYLADVDRDGTEELFVKIGENEWNDRFLVYSDATGRALPLGTVSGRKTTLATDGETVYSVYTDPESGDESIYALGVDGGVTIREISHRTGLRAEEMDGQNKLGAVTITGFEISDRRGL